jgi:hypothetical protein
MIEILANVLKECCPPVIASEPAFALPMICVDVRPAAIAIKPVLASANRAAVLSKTTFITAFITAARSRATVLREGSAAAPHHPESIPLRTAGGIFDTNYSGTTVSRVSYEFLLAAPVNSFKTETARIRRHNRSAFEAAPLRRIARQISQNAVPSYTNLNLGRAVNHHFDSTLAVVRITPSGHGRASREGLSTRNRPYCYHS